MNQEMRKNKEIAEFCGWVRIKEFTIEDSPVSTSHKYLAGYHPIYHSPLQFNYETPIPNYVSDLNAMHKAEETLDGYLMLYYSENLMYALNTGGGSYLHIHAPANARADAFLKTIRDFKKSKR